MQFQSKIDKYFLIFISIVILIVISAFLIPMFLDDSRSSLDTVIGLSLCILIIGFILWCSFSIKYVFLKECIFVKAGLFRSRIPYETIIKVSPTSEILTGYRLLSSKEGIEIFYTTGILGSVKISPKNVESFIEEIKKHCPNARVIR
ncbi:PH domain-containing protein [Bacillus sp. RG28]|uniref:PH domain-containing protein n=2 Tax=Gottfriedia endophytica TaxID=2820819 RepID=A0A940NVT1_9BACI|nr:PH domain-containing protein [Gottfriedia endophytica]